MSSSNDQLIEQITADLARLSIVSTAPNKSPILLPNELLIAIVSALPVHYYFRLKRFTAKYPKTVSPSFFKALQDNQSLANQLRKYETHDSSDSVRPLLSAKLISGAENVAADLKQRESIYWAHQEGVECHLHGVSSLAEGGISTGRPLLKGKHFLLSLAWGRVWFPLFMILDVRGGKTDFIEREQATWPRLALTGKYFAFVRRTADLVLCTWPLNRKGTGRMDHNACNKIILGSNASWSVEALGGCDEVIAVLLRTHDYRYCRLMVCGETKCDLMMIFPVRPQGFLTWFCGVDVTSLIWLFFVSAMPERPVIGVVCYDLTGKRLFTKEVVYKRKIKRSYCSLRRRIVVRPVGMVNTWHLVVTHDFLEENILLAVKDGEICIRSIPQGVAVWKGNCYASDGTKMVVNKKLSPRKHVLMNDSLMISYEGKDYVPQDTPMSAFDISANVFDPTLLRPITPSEVRM